MVKRQILRALGLTSMVVGLAACTAADEGNNGAFPAATMSTTAAPATSGKADDGDDDDGDNDDNDDESESDSDDGTTTGVDSDPSDTSPATTASTTAASTTTTGSGPATTGMSGGTTWEGGSSGGFGSGGELCTPTMIPEVCNAFGAKVAECFGEDANVEAQFCACDLEFLGGDACGMAVAQHYGCLATAECTAFDDENACGAAELEGICGG